jgi:hypothetical protein
MRVFGYAKTLRGFFENRHGRQGFEMRLGRNTLKPVFSKQKTGFSTN